MSKKPTLDKLALDLEKTESPKPSAVPLQIPQVGEANPARGQRQAYPKITITISPEILTALRMMQAQRQAQGLPNHGLSEIIREAVTFWLERRGEKS